jgi:PAS domain S-box-containing protein
VTRQRRPKAEAAREGASSVDELRQALRASEERYRALVESHAEMLCRFRPDGTILFVNRAYAEAWNTTPEALTGRNFWEIVSDTDRPAVRAMLDSLTPESPERRIENRIRSASGERWVLWTNRGILFDEHGRLIEAQSAGIDISDRKQMEVALYESDRRKDEFLATLAHELRNPLAPISNSLEILKHADGDSEVLQRAREAIERQVAHLVRLVDDLLDVSRITRDKLELRKSYIDLCSVVTEAVENCRSTAEGEKRTIEASLPDEPLWLDADAVRLAQVLNNLLNNACKYTAAGGSIGIEVKQAGTEAVIAVRDSGIGMPPDKLDTVFDMFSQVKAPTSASTGGLGIGLTLVKRLVELHGGSVSAQSAGLGKGSEFVVRLPIPAEGTERAEGELAAAGGCSLPRRVLIVDDNVDNADSLATLLKLGGHETHTAYDGAAGVELAERFRPDVVLLDLGLPNLSGMEACRRIRGKPWGKEMLIAALTGWGQDKDRQDSLAAGFDEHLVKPVALATITRLLASLDQEQERGQTRRARPVA